jgi:hypothetical protein
MSTPACLNSGTVLMHVHASTPRTGDEHLVGLKTSLPVVALYFAWKRVGAKSEEVFSFIAVIV